MRFVFETKQLKNADDVRAWIVENLGCECSVVVTPNNTIIVTSVDIGKSEVDGLKEWIAENMDGRLVRVEPEVESIDKSGSDKSESRESKIGWMRR